MPSPDADVLAAREAVRTAARLVVLTGAGMSAESGVPTFRDAQSGLWAQFRPEELATEDAFRAHPQRVWDWYAMRREAIARVQPNAGHRALAAFARREPGRLTLVTQNVDGLHQRAGSPDVIALHGDLFADRWLDRCPGRPGTDARRVSCDPSGAEPGRPPRCGHCGHLVRPGVVWFGELLPRQALEEAERAARRADLMLVVGTSGAVYPAAGLARLARESGARVLILNPEPSELDAVAHACLRATAATALPILLEAEEPT